MPVSEVRGWVWSGNVRTGLEYVSRWVGYEFDDTDWQAVENGLPDTSAEEPERWYDYPIVGSPQLVVLVAVNPGADPVDIRVQGEMDDILAVRIETLLSVLADVMPRTDIHGRG
jgi:hypothetical protein